MTDLETENEYLRERIKVLEKRIELLMQEVSDLNDTAMSLINYDEPGEITSLYDYNPPIGVI